ncbi:stage II sporulation protein M [Candidatus Pacearchaeota archaeon]|nr:stage II sporulation protein M [Candidatus Pacearchaeota archaeon]
MLEMIINPKKAERQPWEMFFVGLVYAALSVFLVDWIFLKDTVLTQYSSIFIVTFTVMFSIPFMYYLIRLEEKKDLVLKGEGSLLREHGKAIFALLFLFLGFIVAFSALYILLPSDVTAKNFQAQIEQYCAINMPLQIRECANQYGVEVPLGGKISASNLEHFFSIFVNNIYVLIFILVFSLAFGAGAIFILVWNAGVIAAAIGIFTNAQIHHLHVGLLRYMIHGIPEIAAYFIAALAGGIISIAVIRHDFKSEKFWQVMRDSIDLVAIALVVLIAAGLIEVFITPTFF